MASSDIVELGEMKNFDGCNYNTNKTLENMNETPASSGNLVDASVGNNQDSQLEYIYWYIGDEKYYPSYPPQEPAQSKLSAKTTTKDFRI